MEELFASVREACEPRIWSEAVRLSRSAMIAVSQKSAEEIELRVQEPGKTVASTVKLWPQEEDWLCDCNGSADPCVHVAAACIALKHDRLSKVTQQSAGYLAYHFSSGPKGELTFERHRVYANEHDTPESSPLRGRLQPFLESSGPDRLVASKQDLAVDVFLERRELGQMHMSPVGLIKKILSTLRGHEHVYFEKQAIEVVEPHAYWQAEVVQDAQQVRVRGRTHPSFAQVFSNGCGLVKLDASGEKRLGLCAFKDCGLLAEEQQMLEKGRTFWPKEHQRFWSHTLPQLKAKISVSEAKLKAGPDVRHDRAQIGCHAELVEGELRFVVFVGYGDPEVYAWLDEHDELVLMEGARSLPARKPRRESQLKAEIQDRIGWAAGHWIRCRGSQAVGAVHRLSSLGFTLPDEVLSAFSVQGQLQLNLQVDKQSGEVALSFPWRAEASGQVKPGTLGLNEVLNAYRQGGRYLALPAEQGSGYLRLPSGLLDKHLQVLEKLQLSSPATRHENQGIQQDQKKTQAFAFRSQPPAYLLPDLVELAKDLGQPAPHVWTKTLQLLRADASGPIERDAQSLGGIREEDQRGQLDMVQPSSGQRPEQLSQVAPVPTHLIEVLRPYQRAGVQWLRTRKSLGLGALLADDMGLGKTLQTISVLEDSSLVIAPTSLLANWQREIQRFRPELKALIYHGARRDWDALQQEADVVITSYGLLRQEVGVWAKRLWKMIVLDESQALKNPDSQVARAAFQLSSSFRVALSGTPMENSLTDIWSQFRFLNPHLLAGREEFEQQTRAGRLSAESLRQHIQPYFLRRTKAEVASDLPPKTQNTLYVQLSEVEASAYRHCLEQRKELNEESSYAQMLRVLLRMRQACCDVRLLPKGRELTQVHDHDQSRQVVEHDPKEGQQVSAYLSSKLQTLKAHLEPVCARGHKVLVFSQWTQMLDLTGHMLDGLHIPFLRLDGNTTNRQELVDRFQAEGQEGSAQVLLMSLKAGGVGLNLTAADYVYFLDPWWNPFAEEQAMDRAHRIGQTKPVFVYRLIAAGTIEEPILALQERKKAQAKAVLTSDRASAPHQVETDQGSGSELSARELRTLLSQA